MTLVVSSQQLEVECRALREENQVLLRAVESFHMSMDSFESKPDNKKLKFYTGLESIAALRNSIAPSIKDHIIAASDRYDETPAESF